MGARLASVPFVERRTTARVQRGLFALALVGLAAGGVLYAVGAHTWSAWSWGAATLVVLIPASVAAVRGLWRREAGVDLIAVLAMAGSLALREALAGAVVAVMLTGGRELEQLAARRARRELRALLARAPRTAHRREDGRFVDADVSDIAAGDVLLVKQGEVIPTDGVLSTTRATLDESALTGESRPVEITAGVNVRSGATNAGGPIEMRASLPASESTYAGIVRLVRAAERSKAQFVRLADRYARVFVPITLAVAGGAWAFSGDAVRALAVVVVATPCPLILAAPAAMVGGVSRAARHGILVKGGAPLETLARATILLLDKTGTITQGHPRVISVETFGPMTADELVRLGASLEQVSAHPFAPALLDEARARRLPLAFPTDTHEALGAGIAGRVGERDVAVGQRAWLSSGLEHAERARAVEMRTAVEGSSSVFVAVDGALAGAILLQDPIRPEAPRALRALRKSGIARIHMVTGDHPDTAELVGDAVGVDRVFAERTPDEKVAVVERVRSEGVTIMVGDGINDAPALALADVGVAMGARGATAASESADVVLTADRLEGLERAVRIARRTRRIARQSAIAGMSLSLAAMAAAAAGFLTPVAGAVLQEAIDLAVILNALRALVGPRLEPARRPEDTALGLEVRRAHEQLRPQVEELAALASRLDRLEPVRARQELAHASELLQRDILPHERDEQARVYPVIARMLEGEDPTGPLIETHHEIQRLTRLFHRLVSQLGPSGPSTQEARDLRRSLYGLHAILSLHFGQEDELYAMLDST